MAFPLFLLLGTAQGAQVTALDADLKPWSGDFDGMLERRLVRVLVPYSRTLYFNDKGAQRGLVADSLKDFEIFLNRKYKLKSRPITVVALPATREALLPELLKGEGDIAAGNLTVTAERGKSVDFSLPVTKNVVEIVVTRTCVARARVPRRSRGAGGARAALLQLLRQPRAPRPALPQGAQASNEAHPCARRARGRGHDGHAGRGPAQDRRRRRLEGEALGGPAADDPAASRARAFGGGDTAWAFRKASPKLAQVVNEFIRTHPTALASGFKTYPKNLRRLRNATADADWQRFEKTIALFRKYGERYSFDYLMVAALGYQESGLDQRKRSHRGAIGIMQLMPETGRTLRVGDISKAEPNVHGGFKYLRQIYDRHLDTEGLDEQNRTLFAIAAYNAGSGRIAGLRSEAAKRGLDPKVWFNNVELIAARRIGQETAVYVRNIYKYYVAYKLQLDALEARRAAASKIEAPKP